MKTFVRSTCLISSSLLFAAAVAAAEKPKIAVFSGPTSTIQSNQPLITSNKARKARGLPLRMGADGNPMVDVLRPQRLAAPAKVYVEAYSAHPLEADMTELYAPPDGYVDSHGNFSRSRKSPADKPVYEVVLDPKDGLYPLPYMARQADGKPWDHDEAYEDAPFEKTRQHHYPDGSRFFEEIERLGGRIFEKAAFDFYRPAPSGGYTKGLAGSKRTDAGTGDIAPEKMGVDFFPYGSPPPRAALAKATNVVQRAMASGKYAGGMWFEGSPGVEDTSYWLHLLIDTDKPLTSNAAQRDRGNISPDGDANIINSIEYILSKVWADEQGRDRLGLVVHQDNLMFASREMVKGDARPGGYVATGGDGGVVGNTTRTPIISYVPNRKHTHTSDVRLTQLPASTTGVRFLSGNLVTVPVQIKDADGSLLGSAIPNVTMVKGARWSSADNSTSTDDEVDILARLEKDLESEPLSGMVAEGTQGGSFVPRTDAALKFVVLHGIPVVKTNRGGTTGYITGNDDNLFIEGMNLISTKARLLLMASLMKFGALPPAAAPNQPTDAEIAAIKAKLKQYQSVFDTH